MMISQDRRIEVILGLSQGESADPAKTKSNWESYLAKHVGGEFAVSGPRETTRLAGAVHVLDVLLSEVGYYQIIGNSDLPPVVCTPGA